MENVLKMSVYAFFVLIVGICVILAWLNKPPSLLGTSGCIALTMFFIFLSYKAIRHFRKTME